MDDHLPPELSELVDLYLVCWENICLCDRCGTYVLHSYLDVVPPVTLSEENNGWPCCCEEDLAAEEEAFYAQVPHDEQMDASEESDG